MDVELRLVSLWISDCRTKKWHQSSVIIGSTRETVTVVLGQLQKENLIQIARRRVVILDLVRLAEVVNEKTPEIGLVEPITRSPMMPRLSSY